MAAEFTLVMSQDESRDTTAWVLLYDPEVFVVTGGVMFLAYPFPTMDDALSVLLYDDLLGDKYMDDTQGFVELVEHALDGDNALGNVRVRRVGEGFRLDVEWFPVSAVAAAS